MTASWLSIHADYACRHSGACCTSNWPIPVETGLIPRIEDAVARGVLAAPLWAVAEGSGGTITAATLPAGIGAVLRPAPGGACVFYDPGAAENRCAIHRELSHGAIPASCRHFPRVCLTDPRRVSVTLSHYCPTAAAMLFRSDRPLEIVAGPEPVPGERPEGLDARNALPPLLSPSVLMDLDAYARWERLVVAIFADDAGCAEDALDRVTRAAERLRSWTPGGVPLEAAVAALAREPARRPPDSRGPKPAAPDVRAFEEVRGCVPAPYAWDPAPVPAAVAAEWDRRAAAGWPALARPVRFYLAAKFFASWVAYQGEGLRTIVRSLHAALSVVKVEALRLAADRDAAVDQDVLRHAFRRADLLLVHHVDREALARAWSRAEHPGRRPSGSW